MALEENWYIQGEKKNVGKIREFLYYIIRYQELASLNLRIHCAFSIAHNCIISAGFYFQKI